MSMKNSVIPARSEEHSASTYCATTCLPKEKREYWKLKEEAIDCTPWRTHFGRGYEHVTMTTE